MHNPRRGVNRLYMLVAQQAGPPQRLWDALGNKSEKMYMHLLAGTKGDANLLSNTIDRLVANNQQGPAEDVEGDA